MLLIDEPSMHALKNLAPIVLAFIVVFILIELSRIPGRLKSKKAYSNLTGRAMGTVTNRYKEQVLLTPYYTSTDNRDHYEYKTRLTYQFEVNGRVYTGEGEGSGAFWQKNQQMICYDPEDPNTNCTLFYLKSKTKSHAHHTLLVFIIMIVLLVLGIYGIGKLGWI